MTRRPDVQNRVPDVIVERYRLGELSPAEMASFGDRLHTDDDLRRRLEALEASDEEIRRQYPPAVLAAQVRRRLDDRQAAARGWRSVRRVGVSWKTAAALAAMLLMAILLGPPLLNLPGGDTEDDRIKGLEPALLLFRKTAEGSEPLADGAVVRKGDLLRVGYRAAGQAFGVILSIDGRGTVTRHLPGSGDQAAALAAGDQALLDSAYELDDAPSWERFYFVSGTGPFDARPIVEAAERVAKVQDQPPPAALPLPATFKQASVLLLKGPDPSARREDRPVRALDACAAGVIEAALARSRTARDLHATLAGSDVVAFVQCAWLTPQQPQGMLVWLSRTPRHRFVLIRLAIDLAPPRRMELLAHELQHAAEVAAAPWVGREPDMGRLFSRIGWKTTTSETYETTAARQAERLVRRDLASPAPEVLPAIEAGGPDRPADAGTVGPPVDVLALNIAVPAPAPNPVKR